MDANTYLHNLAVGSMGSVVGYDKAYGGYKGRLSAMGLTPGTVFTVVYRDLQDGSVELKVGAIALTLRKQEANALCVEELELSLPAIFKADGFVASHLN